MGDGKRHPCRGGAFVAIRQPSLRRARRTVGLATWIRRSRRWRARWSARGRTGPRRGDRTAVEPCDRVAKVLTAEHFTREHAGVAVFAFLAVVGGTRRGRGRRTGASVSSGGPTRRADQPRGQARAGTGRGRSGAPCVCAEALPFSAAARCVAKALTSSPSACRNAARMDGTPPPSARRPLGSPAGAARQQGGGPAKQGPAATPTAPLRRVPTYPLTPS